MPVITSTVRTTFTAIKWVHTYVVYYMPPLYTVCVLSCRVVVCSGFVQTRMLTFVAPSPSLYWSVT